MNRRLIDGKCRTELVQSGAGIPEWSYHDEPLRPTEFARSRGDLIGERRLEIVKDSDVAVPKPPLHGSPEHGRRCKAPVRP